MATMRCMVSFPGLLVALLGGAAAAQDTGSALSTILQTAKSDAYGAYLVTAEGRPIYVFSADTPRSAGVDANSLCSDACTRQWPPLIASAGAVASPEIDVALISKTQREDGASQVLFGGHPVYLFAGDQPGEPPSGHGHSAYGGVWQLIAPDGSPIAPEDGGIRGYIRSLIRAAGDPLTARSLPLATRAIAAA
jgi:predicted lipoprotein with Yx(FWY)xxD motif